MQNEIKQTNERSGWRTTAIDDGSWRSIFHFHIVRLVKRRLLDCFMLSQFALNTLFIEWMKRVIIIVFRCLGSRHTQTRKRTNERTNGPNRVLCLNKFFSRVSLPNHHDELMQSCNFSILSAKKVETIKLDASFEQNKLIAKEIHRRSTSILWNGFFFLFRFYSARRLIISSFFFRLRFFVYIYSKNIDIQF